MVGLLLWREDDPQGRGRGCLSSPCASANSTSCSPQEPPKLPKGTAKPGSSGKDGGSESTEEVRNEDTSPGQLLDGQEGKGTQGPKVIWAKGKEALSTAWDMLASLFRSENPQARNEALQPLGPGSSNFKY